MRNTCLYCNSPFIGERSTKKYCDDNCRQLAYIARKKAKGAFQEVRLHTLESPFSVKPEVKSAFYAGGLAPKINSETKGINSFKGAESKATEQDSLEGTNPIKKLTDKLEKLESVITEQNNLILTMWTNIKAALETNKLEVVSELRAELSRNRDFWRGLNGVNYCNPCAITLLALSPSVANIIPSESYNIKHSNRETEELTQANRRIKDLEERLIAGLSPEQKEANKIDVQDDEENSSSLSEELNDELEKKKPESDQREQIFEDEPQQSEAKLIELASEKPYQFIHPKLHILLQNQLDKGDGGYKFRHALRFWPIEQTTSILWVNVRLRCLLNNLIRLSIRAHTNYETLAALTNAFVSLSQSEHYKKLPLDYPYINIIAEQTDLLRGKARKSYLARTQKVRIWMSIEQKATIMAACSELAQSTEKVSFSDLSFKTVKLERSFIERAKAIRKET